MNVFFYLIFWFESIAQLQVVSDTYCTLYFFFIIIIYLFQKKDLGISLTWTWSLIHFAITQFQMWCCMVCF